MMEHSGIVKQLRIRVFSLLFLRNLLNYTSITGFILGTIALLLRIIVRTEPQTLAWLTLGFIPPVIASLILAVRKTPPNKSIYALFDEKNRSGGLLMAAQQISLGAWSSSIPAIKTPKIKFKATKSSAMFLASLVFIAVCVLMPQRYVNIAAAKPLDITRDVEALTEQIETLVQEDIIAEEQADQYEQKLEQIHKEAQADDPVKTWESLDQLAQSLKKQALQEASSTINETESLAMAEALAQGLGASPDELSQTVMAETMKAMAEMAKDMLKENQLLKKELSENCQNALKAGKLSPEQLKELLKALQNCKLSNSQCLGNLCDAGLIDPKMLKLCEKAGNCNSEGLMAFLKENGGCMGVGQSLSAFCNSPGKGGINRGRGDAPMTWTQGSSEEGVAFKEQVLPPASLEALKKSVIAGISVGQHNVDNNSPANTASVLNSAAAGSGQTTTNTILPRHRGAVKRYFNTEQ